MPSILLPRDTKEIKKELARDDRVVVTSCTMCPEKAGIKLPAIMKDIAKWAKVVGFLKYPTGCKADFVEEFRERLLGMKPTALVVVDCTAAVAAHKYLYPQLKVIQGCITIGCGYGDPKSGFIECAFPFEGYEKYQGLRIKLYTGEIIREGVGNAQEPSVKKGGKKITGGE